MLVGSCLWLGSAVAQAQKPKVVVMDFTGSGGATARAQVLRALRDKVVFEPRNEAKKVLASRGVKLSSVAGRATIAKELPVDYVVWGRVRGRGASARAEIRIAGPQGKQITERDAGPPGQSKGNARIQKAAQVVVAQAIKVAPPQRHVATAEPVAVSEIRITLGDETKPSKKAEKAEKAETPKKQETKDEEKPRTSTAPRSPIINVLGGAGGRVRNIKINVDDGAGGTATREYQSGLYLDIVFRLELRPLARSRKKGLRGLALEVDADFGIGLETETQGSTAKLDTKTWRILGQLGYFYGLGKSEVGGLLGIGFDDFDIEDNGTLPSIRYLFLRVGPAFRYLFIERTLYLRVDGGFRLPFSYGELADTFGDAKGFGFDAGLMVGGELDVGFSYALRVSFDYFKPQFSAFPDGMVPGLPAAAQGVDGTDFAINFHAMVGWAF
jgi:hypothetical protein